MSATSKNWIDRLVGQIRREIVRNEVKRPRSRVSASLSGRLQSSAHLVRLNRHWQVDARAEIRSHRPWVGPLIVAVKRMLRPILLRLLEPYLAREREFFRDVVRFQNEVAQTLDQRFEELDSRLRMVETEMLRLSEEFEKNRDPEARTNRPPEPPGDDE